MDTFIEILKVVGAIFVLGQPILGIYLIKKMKKKHSDFPSMSESQLIALAQAKPFLHLNKVIEELKSRDTDYHMLVPDAVTLATDNKSAPRIFGWHILKEHFRDDFPEIDFDKDKLTRAELNLLKEKTANQGMDLTR